MKQYVVRVSQASVIVLLFLWVCINTFLDTFAMIPPILASLY